MTRCDWKNIQPFKFILNLLGKKDKPALETPWQVELENLAERYSRDPMGSTTYEVVGDSLETEEEADALRQLCKDVKEDIEINDRIVVRKVDKRKTDETSVDMKAWWGQAVATWDPVNAKNVDSIDQQRRPRKSKWFDKV